MYQKARRQAALLKLVREGTMRNQNEVVRARAGRLLGDSARTLHASTVGHRMAALVQFDAPQGPDVAVLDVQQATGDPAAQHPLRRAPHGVAGLSRPQHVNIPVSREVFAGKLPGHRLTRIGRLQRRLENRSRTTAESGFELHLNSGRRITASTATDGSSLSIGMRWSARE